MFVVKPTQNDIFSIWNGCSPQLDARWEQQVWRSCSAAKLISTDAIRLTSQSKPWRWGKRSEQGVFRSILCCVGVQSWLTAVFWEKAK